MSRHHCCRSHHHHHSRRDRCEQPMANVFPATIVPVGSPMRGTCVETPNGTFCTVNVDDERYRRR